MAVKKTRKIIDSPALDRLIEAHLNRDSMRQQVGDLDAEELAQYKNNYKEFLSRVAEMESSGNFKAKNTSKGADGDPSTAKGAFQFVDMAVEPAINRLLKYLPEEDLAELDPDNPNWVQDLIESKDMRTLDPKLQALLAAGDLLEKSVANEEGEVVSGYGDNLNLGIMQGDLTAYDKMYRLGHHTWEPDKAKTKAYLDVGKRSGRVMAADTQAVTKTPTISLVSDRTTSTALAPVVDVLGVTDEPRRPYDPPASSIYDDLVGKGVPLEELSPQERRNRLDAENAARRAQERYDADRIGVAPFRKPRNIFEDLGGIGTQKVQPRTEGGPYPVGGIGTRKIRDPIEGDGLRFVMEGIKEIPGRIKRFEDKYTSGRGFTPGLGTGIVSMPNEVTPEPEVTFVPEMPPMPPPVPEPILGEQPVSVLPEMVMIPRKQADSALDIAAEGFDARRGSDTDILAASSAQMIPKDSPAYLRLLDSRRRPDFGRYRGGIVSKYAMGGPVVDPSGIAALGRHGDSQLVHMTPNELHALQKIARDNGVSLTVNPLTGLPEAFSMAAILPMLAGMGAGAAGISPIIAALGIGLTTKLITGDWRKGISAGMGGLSGAGIGKGVLGAGATTEAGAKAALGSEYDAARRLATADANKAVLALGDSAKIQAQRQAFQREFSKSMANRAAAAAANRGVSFSNMGRNLKQSFAGLKNITGIGSPKGISPVVDYAKPSYQGPTIEGLPGKPSGPTVVRGTPVALDQEVLGIPGLKSDFTGPEAKAWLRKPSYAASDAATEKFKKGAVEKWRVEHYLPPHYLPPQDYSTDTVTGLEAFNPTAKKDWQRGGLGMLTSAIPLALSSSAQYSGEVDSPGSREGSEGKYPDEAPYGYVMPKRTATFSRSPFDTAEGMYFAPNPYPGVTGYEPYRPVQARGGGLVDLVPYQEGGEVDAGEALQTVSSLLGESGTMPTYEGTMPDYEGTFPGSPTTPTQTGGGLGSLGEQAYFSPNRGGGYGMDITKYLESLDERSIPRMTGFVGPSAPTDLSALSGGRAWHHIPDPAIEDPATNPFPRGVFYRPGNAFMPGGVFTPTRDFESYTPGVSPVHTVTTSPFTNTTRTMTSEDQSPGTPWEAQGMTRGEYYSPKEQALRGRWPVDQYQEYLIRGMGKPNELQAMGTPGWQNIGPTSTQSSGPFGLGAPSRIPYGVIGGVTRQTAGPGGYGAMSPGMPGAGISTFPNVGMTTPWPSPYFVGKEKGWFAEGGLTAGPGDGMSDEIMTTISGDRAAALSPGEFIIPADVVSGVGNGDTSAGARKLYAMMDRVREARTGGTVQPPAINARKVMPI